MTVGGFLHLSVRFLAWLVLLVAVGCAPRSRAVERAALAATPLPAAEFAVAVLVAGSDEQAVFDNARNAFAAVLRRISRTPLVLTMLSASRDAMMEDVLPATLENIDAAFARTAPKAAACLLFVTSHGTRRGLVLTYHEELLTPQRLDAILDRHCAGKPAIAIISGCFSGIFADPPARPRTASSSPWPRAIAPRSAAATI